jgi:hypothetical protein
MCVDLLWFHVCVYPVHTDCLFWLQPAEQYYTVHLGKPFNVCDVANLVPRYQVLSMYHTSYFHFYFGSCMVKMVLSTWSFRCYFILLELCRPFTSDWNLLWLSIYFLNCYICWVEAKIKLSCNDCEGKGFARETSEGLHPTGRKTFLVHWQRLGSYFVKPNLMI